MNKFGCVFFYLWTSGYRGVIVHAQPAAHSIPEDRDRVPLTDDDATLADYLSGSRSTIKPGEWGDQKSDISNFPLEFRSKYDLRIYHIVKYCSVICALGLERLE